MLALFHCKFEKENYKNHLKFITENDIRKNKQFRKFRKPLLRCKAFVGNSQITLVDKTKTKL